MELITSLYNQITNLHLPHQFTYGGHLQETSSQQHLKTVFNFCMEILTSNKTIQKTSYYLFQWYRKPDQTTWIQLLILKCFWAVLKSFFYLSCAIMLLSSNHKINRDCIASFVHCCVPVPSNSAIRGCLYFPFLPTSSHYGP